MYVHKVTHDGVISFVGEAGSGLDNGGYGSYQDGFFHSGFSNKYAKFDIANLAQIGTGTSGLVNRDEDFGQVLGNLVYVGNDHGQGSALIAHQTAPDTNGPEVHWVHPQDGEGLRNTITLVGKSGRGQGDVHWTANFDEIQDFENDIRNGFGGTGFLSNPDFSVTANPLGNPKAGLSAELDALAAYVSSLDTTPQSPYRNPDGSLTPNGEEGSHTFQVVATDGAGNPDPTPARHTWTLNTLPPAGVLITDIVVSNDNIYQQDTLSVGRLTYIDRSYTFTSVPNHYVGQELIITANNDKAATDRDFLTFDLSADATVDVLFDNRVGTLPAWLDDGSWTLMDGIIDTSDVSRRIYRKDFVAGPVVLGGNAVAPMQGASSNYNVVIIAK